MSEILSDGRSRAMHTEMILDPFHWPHMYLPLKRRREAGQQLGLLTSALTQRQYERHIAAGDKELFTVKGNLTIFGSSLGEVEEMKYDTVDALLDDGWVVD